MFDLHQVTCDNPCSTARTHVYISPFWVHTQLGQIYRRYNSALRQRPDSSQRHAFILAHKVVSKRCQRDVNWFHRMLLDHGRSERSRQLCQKQWEGVPHIFLCMHIDLKHMFCSSASESALFLIRRDRGHLRSSVCSLHPQALLLCVSSVSVCFMLGTSFL